MVKIEEGKFYRTRDGRQVGPMKVNDDEWRHTHPSRFGGESYTPEGLTSTANIEYECDIIAEWLEGPVRTVTRREIVPGDYGRVKVGSEYGASAIWVEITEGKGGSLALTADELRSAAMIFSQLAEALDSNEETK